MTIFLKTHKTLKTRCFTAPCRWCNVLFCQRPYCDEHTRSHPNSEVKHRKARSVLGWGTAWEALRVPLAFLKNFMRLLEKLRDMLRNESMQNHRQFGSAFKSAVHFSRIPLEIYRFCLEICYPRGFATLSSSAMPEATSGLGRSKLREPAPRRKIDVKREPPVGGVSVFTLIRTDTTLDHSQKAEKV